MRKRYKLGGIELFTVSIWPALVEQISENLRGLGQILLKIWCDEWKCKFNFLRQNPEKTGLKVEVDEFLVKKLIITLNKAYQTVFNYIRVSKLVHFDYFQSISHTQRGNFNKKRNLGILQPLD